METIIESNTSSVVKLWAITQAHIRTVHEKIGIASKYMRERE